MALPMASIPNLVLHESTDRSKINATDVFSTWLSKFESTVESGDTSKLEDLFLEDSWWRDVISLYWSLKSFHGQDIADPINKAHQVGFASLKPATSGALIPQLADMGPFTLIEGAFTFETKIGRGRGFLRLGNTAPNEWKAWIIMTNLQEIKGHEELHKMSVGPNWSTPEDAHEYETMSQNNPRVVIIGAGHSALALSARLKQLGVPTLMVDKLSRVGDSWRQRYMNLNLHDPRWENHMPYFKFPETFPAWYVS
jgi:putative flavoprotein involved in K+ transport